MDAETPSNSGGMKKEPKVYFAFAAVFLFLMALFWSVDDSIVYIFFGAASFFLFLGFYNSPKKNSEQSHKQSYHREKKEFSITPAFEDVLKNIFQRKKTESSSGRPNPAQRRGRTIVAIAVISFFVIFLIPILTTIFGSGGVSYDAGNYYTDAEQYYFSQQYDSAYINYKRALQLDPEYEEAIRGYGNVLIVRNERDSAIIMFDKALDINPDYKEASYSKALAFYDQKKYSEGVILLTQLIEDNPDYYDAMLLLGDCFYIQAKYEDALPWYESAYQNGGMRSRMLCHIMAYIYDTKGEYDKAIGLYQEALSYDSSVVDIYQRLGELIQGDDGNFYRTKAVQLKR